jgi:hypothetical protein
MCEKFAVISRPAYGVYGQASTNTQSFLPRISTSVHGAAYDSLHCK